MAQGGKEIGAVAWQRGEQQGEGQDLAHGIFSGGGGFVGQQQVFVLEDAFEFVVGDDELRYIWGENTAKLAYPRRYR